MDPSEAAVVLASAVIGGLIPGLAGFLGDQVKERRRRAEDLRTSRLDRIKQTRRKLEATVDQLTASGLGKLDDAKKARERAAAQEDGSLFLVGNDSVALAYRSLIVAIAERQGATLPIEIQIQSLEVMNRVSKALGDQEELARNGKALRQLSDSTVADLSDVRSLAEKIPLFDQQPTIPARIVRQILKVLRR